jgi:hypothetical protein
MRQSMERSLTALESEYLTLLRAALQQCASGQWGLFGHNDAAMSQFGKPARDRLVSVEARQLLDLGLEIETLRSKLGYVEPFPLHARLTKMRESVDANTQGEPKRARQWLTELEGDQ